MSRAANPSPCQARLRPRDTLGVGIRHETRGPSHGDADAPPSLPEDQVAGVHRALRTLAQNLTQAFESLVPGDPEDQLKTHMQPFVVESGLAFGRLGVVAKTESRVADVHGRPDLRVGVREALTGHIELKVPGHGVDPKNFRGHDQRQTFKNMPNLIYTNGLEWMLLHTEQRGTWPAQRQHDLHIGISTGRPATGKLGFTASLIRSRLRW